MAKKKSKYYEGLIPFNSDDEMLEYGGDCYITLDDWNPELKTGSFNSYLDGKQNIDLSHVNIIETKKGTGVGFASKDQTWVHFDNFKPNYVFETEMIFDGYGRGRSAAHFYLKDEDGKKYTLFMTDMSDILNKCLINKGKIEKRKWTFCKRGANYGVCLYEE